MRISDVVVGKLVIPLGKRRTITVQPGHVVITHGNGERLLAVDVELTKPMTLIEEQS